MFFFSTPNQQRTLNKFPTELQCRKFANKHRLSIQIGAKRAKDVCNEYSILHTTVGGGWVSPQHTTTATTTTNVPKRVCNVYRFQLSFHFAYHQLVVGLTHSASDLELLVRSCLQVAIAIPLPPPPLPFFLKKKRRLSCHPLSPS